MERNSIECNDFHNKLLFIDKLELISLKFICHLLQNIYVFIYIYILFIFNIYFILFVMLKSWNF